MVMALACWCKCKYIYIYTCRCTSTCKCWCSCRCTWECRFICKCNCTCGCKWWWHCYVDCACVCMCICSPWACVGFLDLYSCISLWETLCESLLLNIQKINWYIINSQTYWICVYLSRLSANQLPELSSMYPLRAPGTLTNCLSGPNP